MPYTSLKFILKLLNDIVGVPAGCMVRQKVNAAGCWLNEFQFESGTSSRRLDYSSTKKEIRQCYNRSHWTHDRLTCPFAAPCRRNLTSRTTAPIGFPRASPHSPSPLDQLSGNDPTDPSEIDEVLQSNDGGIDVFDEMSIDASERSERSSSPWWSSQYEMIELYASPIVPEVPL